MSTVLKAVQELDRQATSLAANSLPADDRRRVPTSAVAIAAIVVLAAGAVVARRWIEAARPTVAVTSVAPPAAAVVAPPPAAVVAAPQPAAVAPAAAVQPLPDPPAPWGRVETDVPERIAASETRTRPKPPVPAPVEPATRRAPVAAPRVAAESKSEGRLAVPRVQVRAIVYAPDPTGRRVVLRIGDAPSVTLHQGESSDGVDVQFITENAVYLRHGGNIFTVGMDR